jgi:hypothetical protein
MKLEKKIHDKTQQILKFGSAIKVIPWTPRVSSRSKTNIANILNFRYFHYANFQ